MGNIAVEQPSRCVTVWRRMLQRSTCQITDAPDSAAPYSSEQSRWIATALSSQPHSAANAGTTGMIASVADKKRQVIVIAVPIASPAGAPIRQRPQEFPFKMHAVHLTNRVFL